MTDSWPVVADTETADLQEFVSEYKQHLGVGALWKVARIVAGEAGVTLQAFDSWDEVQASQEASQETGSDSADAATTGRAPGGFGGSLLSRSGFGDPLDEEMLDAFEGRGGADGDSGYRVRRWPDADRVGNDG